MIKLINILLEVIKVNSKGELEDDNPKDDDEELEAGGFLQNLGFEVIRINPDQKSWYIEAVNGGAFPSSQDLNKTLSGIKRYPKNRINGILRHDEGWSWDGKHKHKETQRKNRKEKKRNIKNRIFSKPKMYYWESAANTNNILHISKDINGLIEFAKNNPEKVINSYFRYDNYWKI